MLAASIQASECAPQSQTSPLPASGMSSAVSISSVTTFEIAANDTIDGEVFVVSGRILHRILTPSCSAANELPTPHHPTAYSFHSSCNEFQNQQTFFSQPQGLQQRLSHAQPQATL